MLGVETQREASFQQMMKFVTESVPTDSALTEDVAVNSSSQAVLESVEEKLHEVEVAPQTLPAVKAMAHDAIFMSQHQRKRSSLVKCHCQGSTALVRIFLQLYQGMLSTAEQAYADLKRMRKAHVQGNVGVATEHFDEAKHACIRVASVVQHIIDCKFDVSEFKCTEQKCNHAAHTSAHIGLINTVAAPSDVPSVFEGREWDEAVAFHHHVFGDEAPGARCHLDYMWAKQSHLTLTSILILSSSLKK